MAILLGAIVIVGLVVVVRGFLEAVRASRAGRM
jgi:hypothetical protein